MTVVHRHNLFPRVLRFTRDYYYYSMKPLWSNEGISLPAADIESETEMLRVAELLRYILRFRFAFMAGPRVWKNVPTTFCQSSQQTQRRRSIIQPHRSTYNSPGPVFFCIFFYFILKFLSCSAETVLHLLLGFSAGARTWQPDHPSQTGQQQKFRQSRAVIQLSRWLTGENKRQMKAVTSLSGPPFVSTEFNGWEDTWVTSSSPDTNFHVWISHWTPIINNPAPILVAPWFTTFLI